MKIISSLSNPLIKDLLKFKKTGERKKRGLIIVDGWREIDLAIKFGWEVASLFYCPDFDKNRGGTFDQIFSRGKTEIIEVSREIFIKICYKEKPDGFLATIKARETILENIKLNENPLVVILENIEKPGNLGAIIRTSAAVGVTAIIVNDNQTDIYNPNVIRASEGHIFSQTLIKASIKETVDWLKVNRIQSFGAATKDSQKYTKADLSDRTAIILGSEADGLSPEWLKAANQLIKIPMLPGVDSLNVSVSAAVILFEALRQRDFNLK